jgi:hypothetical protein
MAVLGNPELQRQIVLNSQSHPDAGWFRFVLYTGDGKVFWSSKDEIGAAYPGYFLELMYDPCDFTCPEHAWVYVHNSAGDVIGHFGFYSGF